VAVSVLVELVVLDVVVEVDELVVLEVVDPVGRLVTVDVLSLPPHAASVRAAAASSPSTAKRCRTAVHTDEGIQILLV
jgi:hypothetical protein